MLREEVLSEWNEFKHRFVCQWKASKSLVSLRSWMAQALLAKQSSQVSNQQIAQAIEELLIPIQGPMISYVSGIDTDTEEEED